MKADVGGGHDRESKRSIFPDSTVTIIGRSNISKARGNYRRRRYKIELGERISSFECRRPSVENTRPGQSDKMFPFFVHGRSILFETNPLGNARFRTTGRSAFGRDTGRNGEQKMSSPFTARHGENSVAGNKRHRTRTTGSDRRCYGRYCYERRTVELN